MQKYEEPFLEFSAVVSKGTYIRALAEDIAEKLGTVGHLVELQRIRIGDFLVKDSFALNALNSEKIEKYILSIEKYNKTREH